MRLLSEKPAIKLPDNTSEEDSGRKQRGGRVESGCNADVDKFVSSSYPVAPCPSATFSHFILSRLSPLLTAFLLSSEFIKKEDDPKITMTDTGQAVPDGVVQGKSLLSTATKPYWKSVTWDFKDVLDIVEEEHWNDIKCHEDVVISNPSYNVRPHGQWPALHTMQCLQMIRQTRWCW